MKKQLVGGLIVISLMSHPIIFTTAVYAYEFYNKEEKMISAYIGVTSSDENDDVMVDALLDSIVKNSEHITALLKEKNEITNDVFDTMQMKAKLKISLTKTEQEEFKKFTVLYEDKEERLLENLRMIDARKQLHFVKDELLHKESDYDLICQDLRELYYYQEDAIDCLNDIIDCGKDFKAAV